MATIPLAQYIASYEADKARVDAKKLGAKLYKEARKRGMPAVDDENTLLGETVTAKPAAPLTQAQVANVNEDARARAMRLRKKALPQSNVLDTLLGG